LTTLARDEIFFHAKDITTAILNGRKPLQLTAQTMRLTPRLPAAWAEQRTLLGFR
jgi:site-specific DNA recombinase